MARETIVVGNWKMHGLSAAREEALALSRMIETARETGGVRAAAVICPPFTLVADFARALSEDRIGVGAQDCHVAEKGAHTGDISAEMLADAGARFVIVGHSERRQDHGETDAMVNAKASAAMRAGLAPIVCVGEQLAERDAGAAERVVVGQVAASTPEGGAEAGLIVAYEPVWAIGTGRTPTLADVAAMHRAIRGALASRYGAEPAEAVRVLYGGSVKPANAAEILACEGVDGALVGGASLKAEDFFTIVEAAPAR